MSSIDIVALIIFAVIFFVFLSLVYYACFKYFCLWADSLPEEQKEKAYKDYIDALLDIDKNEII